MGLLSTLGSGLNWLLKKANVKFPWVYGSTSSMGMLVNAWTDSRIELVRHFRHWTYVAINRIGEKISQQQPNFSIVRGSGDGDQSKYLSPATRSRALTPLLSHENLEPIPLNHPLVELIANANSFDTQFDLWYETVMYLLLTGSSYWWTPRNRAGLPTEIWVLPAHWVWPVVTKDRGFEAYQLRPVEGYASGWKIPAEDVIHFKKKNPISKLDGYSPQTAGGQWIDGVESIDKARWHTFRNGMMPGLAVEFDINAQAPSEEQLNRIEARMANRYSGEHKSGVPLFVPPGSKIKPLTVTPREMDFNTSFEQLRDSVLALYGVPAVVAGITKDMTYGSVMAALAAFCTFTVNPLVASIGQTLTLHLARQYDEKIRVWWPDCTPEDPEVREKELKLDASVGAISVNELRALRGRKPWEGGICPDGDQPAKLATKPRDVSSLSEEEIR